MRHIVMHAGLVAASLTVVACTESPAPTALRPSFAAGGRGPAVFITDVSRDTTAQNETPIAVNPTNPSNLLTGANDWNYNDGVAYNVSFDGGKTWSATLPDGFIPGLTRYTNDPAVPGTGVYDAAGDPYVGYGPDGTQSPVQVACSRDGARTFSTPVQITPAPIRNNQDARIAIAPDGALYLTFDNGIQGGKGTANYVSVSKDGGATWSAPTLFSMYNNPVCLYPPYCFNISGGAFRGPSSYPAPAFDARRNRIAVVYSDIDVDGRAKVFFTSATADRATSAAAWSTPRVIALGTGDRFGAELSAASGGRLDVMFDDRSYSGNALVDVTYASSTDGGATWNSTRVSKAGFDASHYGVPCSTCVGGIRPFLGDYNGIASLSGQALMTWTGVASKTGTANDNLEIFFGSVTP